MGYVLTKEDPGGRIYALITPTRLIDYTLDIDTASVFQDKNEAEDLRKRATKKLRGFPGRADVLQYWCFPRSLSYTDGCLYT